jgi:putative transposase
MGEMVLAILFTEETPFSQMRAKAAQLAHTLLSSPLQEEKASWIQNSSEGAQDDNPALETAPTNAVQPVLLPQKAPTAPASPASTLAEPRVSLAASTAIPLTPQPVILQGTPPTSIPQMPPLDHNETISSPLPGRAEIPNMGPTSRPADYTSGAPAASASWMPAASPVISDLYLAIVLLPRMPKHHLTGDLATLLPQWIAQVCVAYGWRLETLHIRPEYVGWVVNIPPSTSASQHLRIMRRQTSQYIFGEFPTIARENPSGEFWAPGYLVTSSSQLPTEGVIQAFINQVRRQQGVSKPFPDQA